MQEIIKVSLLVGLSIRVIALEQDNIVSTDIKLLAEVTENRDMLDKIQLIGHIQSIYNLDHSLAVSFAGINSLAASPGLTIYLFVLKVPFQF